MAKVDLYPDFKELLESLNSAGVKYLVIGGYAVIFYGYRRVTDDLDIWIAIDPENAEKVSHVLQKFGGFAPSKVRPSMFQTTGKVFIFGREPVRVDILTSPDGVNFKASHARRQIADWDGIKVPLISLEDLKANKRASGRAKDLADIENLPSSIPKTKRRRGTK
ncbi:MAG TPA: nucleotidyltransferase [Tepidisphaeraceae bacterium]|jgi:predicted nucleotidyltransferase|nr:nucleotidyltransferase [Tepidisphaeraceae bacterium]